MTTAFGDEAQAGPSPCAKCGKLHTHDGTPTGRVTCRAHNRAGQMCKLAPMRGGFVCRMHGGSTPKVKKAAAERKILSFTEGKIKKLLDECDIPSKHPLDGLLEVVQRAGAMMRLLGGLVGELDPENRTEVTGVDDAGNFVLKQLGIYGPDHNGDAAPHILLTLYGQWSDRYARACKLALDANIDERMIRNAEATTDVFFTALKKALDAVSLDPVQRGLFNGTLAAELRRLTGPIEKRLEVSAP